MPSPPAPLPQGEGSQCLVIASPIVVDEGRRTAYIPSLAGTAVRESVLAPSPACGGGGR